MSYRNQMARDFAQRMVGLGFRAFVAREGEGDYGIVTDDTGDRVLSFSMNDGGSLSGNYGPPTQRSGTGWRMNTHPFALLTADDVHKALHERPPLYCGGGGGGSGWRKFTTLAEHLKMYGSSSRYAEIQK